MPLTPNAFQVSTDGSDFYLAVFTADFKTVGIWHLLWWRHQSRAWLTVGQAVFDKRGCRNTNQCVRGCGGFSDFPTTIDAYSRTNNGTRPNNPTLGGCNNALFKFNLNVSDKAPVVRDTFISLQASDVLNYTQYMPDPDGDSVSATLTGSTSKLSSIFVFQGKTYASATLRWNTQCSDISSDTIVINVRAADNACPTPNVSFAKIKLLVTPPPAVAAPYPQCLQTLNDSTVALKWTPPSNLKYFKRYTIYRKKK